MEHASLAETRRLDRGERVPPETGVRKGAAASALGQLRCLQRYMQDRAREISANQLPFHLYRQMMSHSGDGRARSRRPCWPVLRRCVTFLL